MLSFNFNGKNSFEQYGIYISTRPSIPSPKRRVNNINVPGRNSTLRFDENTYEDITLTVECSIKGEVIQEKIDSIKGWLVGSGESNLTFSFQEDRQYVAQVVNAIDFSQVIKQFSKFIIIFNCEPFKYKVESEILTLSNGGNIINPGSIYSEPIINVYGTGNLTIKVNGETINLFDIGGQIIIDCITQNCYNDSLENLNSKMNGEFPVLNTGQNNISWSGNISKVEVSPKWRWL